MKKNENRNENENKKESVLGSIVNAIRLIYEGDSAFVYFTFYKNITEEIFNALYGIYLIKYIYECIEKGSGQVKKQYIVVDDVLIEPKEDYNGYITDEIIDALEKALKSGIWYE